MSFCSCVLHDVIALAYNRHRKENGDEMYVASATESHVVSNEAVSETSKEGENSNIGIDKLLSGIKLKSGAKKLSHKQWRRYLKKMRRREARQDYAKRKEHEEEEDEQRKAEDEYYKVRSKVEAKRRDEVDKDEETKRDRDHDAWVQREKDAVNDLKKKQQEEEERIKQKEESERKIRSEWDEKEKRAKDTQDSKDKKEDVFKKEMNNLDKQNDRNDSRYRNPEQAPTEIRNQSYVPRTNLMDPTGMDLISLAMDPRNCKFYLKTGACRFGPKCSRNHLKFNNSTTVLIQNFFQDARLSIPILNERNNDADLEYDEVDLIHEFEKFYDDVIGEFRAAGTVVMFKCCQNYVPHLRGNVYVQYSRNEEALEAMQMFNGRYYAGKMLTIELSPVTNWTSSICGLFDKRLCPRGKACNFLHVFRNPGNAYSVPNRTDFDPERAFRSGGYDPKFVNPNHPVFKYYNQRDAYGYRSEDAVRSGGYGRNRWDTKEFHTRSRDRDRKRRRHSRSRSHSRGRSHSRSYSSRSRSRSKSKSRRRRRSRSKTYSRSRSRSPSRSRSKDRSKRSRKHSRSSSNSSKGSSKKKSGKNSEISDTSTDWSDLSED